MPALQPVELWKESGRFEAYGDLLMKLTISGGHQMALGPTHEEVITDIVRDLIRSYKQLPITLYQIQTKFRDEPRPRFGIVRTREFVMKDAYSIDADLGQLNASYDKMYEAYCRIFDRCGLPYVIVEAESGPIGGDSSHEFMVPCSTGEDTVIFCEKCGYAANQERAEVGGHDHPTRTPDAAAPAYQAVQHARQADDPRGLRVPRRRGADLGQAAGLPGRRQAGRRAAAGRPRAQRGQVPPGRRRHGGRPGRRGDDREGDRHPDGLPRAGGDQDPDGDRPRDRRDADGRRRRQRGRRPLQGGRARPRLPARAGSTTSATPRPATPARAAAAALEVKSGLEIGHVFKLGTKYSKAMGATYLDEKGHETHVIMGCYGIGVNRIVAAAVEASHDANGIVWPLLAGAVSRAARAAAAPERGRDGADRGARVGPGGGRAGRAGRRPRPAAGLQVQGRGPDRHPAPRGGRRARAQGGEDRDQVAARVGGEAGPGGVGGPGDPRRGRRRAPATRRVRAPSAGRPGPRRRRHEPDPPPAPAAECPARPAIARLFRRAAGRSGSSSAVGRAANGRPTAPSNGSSSALVITAAAALFVACITVGWWYPWPGRGRGRAGIER